MKETTMFNAIKPYFIEESIWFTRIENRTGMVPDIYFASKWGNGWIELKQGRVTNHDGYVKKLTLPFRKGQLSWIREHLKYNRNIFVVASIEGGFILQYGSEVRKEAYGRIFPLTKELLIHTFINCLKGDRIQTPL